MACSADLLTSISQNRGFRPLHLIQFAKPGYPQLRHRPVNGSMQATTAFEVLLNCRLKGSMSSSASSALSYLAPQLWDRVALRSFPQRIPIFPTKVDFDRPRYRFDPLNFIGADDGQRLRGMPQQPGVGQLIQCRIVVF